MIEYTDDGEKKFEETFANGGRYKLLVYRKIKEYNSQVQGTSVDGELSYYYQIDELEQDAAVDLYRSPRLNSFSIRVGSDGEKYTKTYNMSDESFKVFGLLNGIKRSDYDCCPDIDFLTGVAFYYNTEGNQIEGMYDLYFNVLDNDNINEISEYYGLPYPLPENNDFDSNPQKWYFGAWSQAIAMAQHKSDHYLNDTYKQGSVKFKNNSPVLFKIYQRHT